MLRDMDLISRDAFWRIDHGSLDHRPTLHRDLRCDVVVVGGGISGAMIAHELVKQGHDTVLLERFDVGSGSTSGSTALIQYETDLSLTDLAEKHGVDFAGRVYRSTYAALDVVRDYAREVGHGPCVPRESYYLASRPEDAQAFEAEVALRRRFGVASTVIDAAEIERRFPFRRAGAILSNALELDPYRMTGDLLRHASNAGLRIFDRTNVVAFDDTGADALEVTTAAGHRIRCRRLVFAIGYEAAAYLPENLVQLHSSYALVSKPMESWEGWHGRALLWETARPYLYLRTTADGRALIGGLDDVSPNAELRDARIPAKAKELEARFRSFFPNLSFDPAYAWGGTFGESPDSLPYLGSVPRYRRVFFACGFGGNGITFSAIAARLFADLIAGRPNEASGFFGFERVKRD